MTTIRIETHPGVGELPVRDDCLLIGGKPVTTLADQAGTPFYAYDRTLIGERIELLRAKLPPSVSLHYAIKANPMPAVVRFIAPLVDGLDVASAGELEVALDAGMRPGAISFAGPAKTASELARAIDAGIVVNMESPREMERLAELARERGQRPRVAIRVNPDFELKTSGMRMSGGPKPFGIDAETVPAVLARLRELPLEFIGFHIYSGSQNLRAETIIEAQDKTCRLAAELARHAPGPVRLVNIGGGFGIPYFPGDRALDLTEIGENLRRSVDGLRRDLPEAEVVVELGRYIVGEAGYYVCRVVDRKDSRGQTFLLTDGGLHHHLAASGNFGQVIRKNYPVLVGNRANADSRETVSVCGPLCTPLDILADKMPMARADVGDLIVVLQSGAYGLTASPTAFLGHPPPAEILV